MHLRDFSRSLPQLNDPSGLNQIAEECDKLIGQLQANATTIGLVREAMRRFQDRPDIAQN